MAGKFEIVPLSSKDKVMANQWAFKVRTPSGDFVRSISALDDAFVDAGISGELPSKPTLYDAWVKCISTIGADKIQRAYISNGCVACVLKDGSFDMKSFENPMVKHSMAYVYGLYAKSPTLRNFLINAKSYADTGSDAFKKLVLLYIKGHCEGVSFNAKDVAVKLFRDSRISGFRPEKLLVCGYLRVDFDPAVMQFVDDVTRMSGGSVQLNLAHTPLNGADHIRGLKGQLPQVGLPTCSVYGVPAQYQGGSAEVINGLLTTDQVQLDCWYEVKSSSGSTSSQKEQFTPDSPECVSFRRSLTSVLNHFVLWSDLLTYNVEYTNRWLETQGYSEGIHNRAYWFAPEFLEESVGTLIGYHLAKGAHAQSFDIHAVLFHAVQLAVSLGIFTEDDPVRLSGLYSQVEGLIPGFMKGKKGSVTSYRGLNVAEPEELGIDYSTTFSVDCLTNATALRKATALLDKVSSLLVLVTEAVHSAHLALTAGVFLGAGFASMYTNLASIQSRLPELIQNPVLISSQYIRDAQVLLDLWYGADPEQVLNLTENTDALTAQLGDVASWCRVFWGTLWNLGFAAVAEPNVRLGKIVDDTSCVHFIECLDWQGFLQAGRAVPAFDCKGLPLKSVEFPGVVRLKGSVTKEDRVSLLKDGTFRFRSLAMLAFATSSSLLGQMYPSEELTTRFKAWLVLYLVKSNSSVVQKTFVAPRFDLPEASFEFNGMPIKVSESIIWPSLQ